MSQVWTHIQLFQQYLCKLMYVGYGIVRVLEGKVCGGISQFFFHSPRHNFHFLFSKNVQWKRTQGDNLPEKNLIVQRHT